MARGVLNTGFFRLLMPHLYKAHPDANMTLIVNATSLPKVTVRGPPTPAAGGNLSLVLNVQLTFVLDDTASTTAFSLSDEPFEATVSLAIKPGPPPANVPAFTGRVAHVDLSLESGSSPFDPIGADVLAALTVPLSLVFNQVLLPLVNAVLGVGLPLSPEVLPLPGYGSLTVGFVSPVVHLSENFVFVATDLAFSFKPN